MRCPRGIGCSASGSVWLLGSYDMAAVVQPTDIPRVCYRVKGVKAHLHKEKMPGAISVEGGSMGVYRLTKIFKEARLELVELSFGNPG